MIINNVNTIVKVIKIVFLNLQVQIQVQKSVKVQEVFLNKIRDHVKNLENENKIIDKKIIVGTKIMKEVVKRTIIITGIKIEIRIIEIDKDKDLKIKINEKNQGRNKE